MTSASLLPWGVSKSTTRTEPSSVLLRFDAIPKAGKDFWLHLTLGPFLKVQDYVI